MNDIALVWNSATGRADFAMAGADIQMDAGLRTEVIIRLFSDRLADPADTLPDNSDDRRGWWGDLPLSGDPRTAGADRIGSGLWLLARELQTQETQRRAENYANTALAPMKQRGAVGSIQVRALYPRLGWIELVITLNQQGSSVVYNFAWQAS